MTSLTEAYEGQMGEYASLRRLYLGVGLFLFGTLLVVAGIGVAATRMGIDALGIAGAREVGTTLGGLGVPAVFLGVFSVLPADRRTRAAAVVGAGVAVLGVALFVHAYPCNWSGTNCGTGYLTLPTVGVYFLGAITTFWCLFVGVANFKSRNDPGGTVKLEITREGETQVVEVPESSLGAKGAMGSLGGVGLLGGAPDGDVETQTNDGGAGEADASRNRGGDAGRSRGGRGGRGGSSPSNLSNATGTRNTRNTRSAPNGTTASDGGATERDIRSLRDDAPAGGSASPSRSGGTDRPSNAGDAYCGSCAHFQYVRTDDGMNPHCGLHDELMDDMDACEEWTPR